eukprot:1160114-Pelagomonas_calceolata.AAC.16
MHLGAAKDKWYCKVGERRCRVAAWTGHHDAFCLKSAACVWQAGLQPEEGGMCPLVGACGCFYKDVVIQTWGHVVEAVTAGAGLCGLEVHDCGNSKTLKQVPSQHRDAFVSCGASSERASMFGRVLLGMCHL